MVKQIQRVLSALIAVFALITSIAVFAPAQADKAVETGSLSGTVTDVNGAPIQGVKIEVLRGTEFFWVANDREVTKADGSFSITGLPADIYRIEFVPTNGEFARLFWESGEVLADAKPIVMAPGQDITGLDVTLAAESGEISGTVTEPDGSPPSDATVALYQQGPDGTFHMYDSYRLLNVELRGLYYFTSLPAGVYRLGFFPNDDRFNNEYSGNQPTLDLAHDIVLAAGEKQTGIDARFDAKPEATQPEVTQPEPQPEVVQPEVVQPLPSALGVYAKAKKKRKVNLVIAVFSQRKVARGNVAIYRGNKRLTTVTLNRRGAAAVTLKKQPRGTTVYTVKYLGNEKAQPVAKKLTVRVKK
jgi:hypothetical protein